MIGKQKKYHYSNQERVPSEIQIKALQIIDRVQDNRLNKDYFPKKEAGEILMQFKLSAVDMTKGEWLILARTNPLLKPIPRYLKSHLGFIF